MPAFRFKCRNPRCHHEFHRHYPTKEYEQLLFNSPDGSYKGIGCYDCGYPNMITVRSNKPVKDGFQPGFQRNIRKHCATYQEYQAWLKKLGLIEIGYQELPERKVDEPFFNEKLIEHINRKYNANLSHRNAQGINEEIKKMG